MTPILLPLVTVTPRDATDAEKARLMQWFLNKTPAGQQVVLDTLNGVEEFVDQLTHDTIHGGPLNMLADKPCEPINLDDWIQP